MVVLLSQTPSCFMANTACDPDEDRKNELIDIANGIIQWNDRTIDIKKEEEAKNPEGQKAKTKKTKAKKPTKSADATKIVTTEQREPGDNSEPEHGREPGDGSEPYRTKTKSRSRSRSEPGVEAGAEVEAEVEAGEEAEAGAEVEAEVEAGVGAIVAEVRVSNKNSI